jgi:hypothetical protein
MSIRLQGMRVFVVAAVIEICLFGAARSADKPAIEAAPTATEAASAWRARQGLNFKRNWGVEIINVKPVSSGYMLALRYRIIDPVKAKVLNDRKSKAYLTDEATGTVLAVPALENVGELRPGATPEADRNYFMIFGNPGKLVKTGSRVDFRVGNLRVDGLVVE